VKRVLIVTPSLPNGLPTQGTLLAARLREEGVDVAVVSRARSSAGRVLDVFTRGALLVARHPIVVVDVFGERAFVYESFAILWASCLRRQVVAMLHNGTMPEFVRRWPRWARFVLTKADIVITPHAFLHDQLKPFGIRVDARIPNFIRLEPYHYRERSVLAPRFLYLRGMSSLYNPLMALHAFAIVQARYPEAVLTMAGADGSDAARCRRVVEELGLWQVRFAGLVPKDEIPKLAQAHDVHLHTNRFDNMPVTILEMWACGLPIVATNVGGVPYLVRDGVDAVLVPSEDHEAMADACLRLLADPERAARLSRNGRSRAESFAWSHIGPEWHRLLFGTAVRAAGAAAGAAPADPAAVGLPAPRKPAES
jgi:glycosyltransferase involved in cell wall biosynthesis